MQTALPLILSTLVATAARIRLAPTDRSRWHVDPLAAEPPEGNGWLVRDGADAQSPRFDAARGDLLARLDAIAMAEPRTRRLAGSVAEGRITYETRSRLWHFPDYTTVTVVEDDGRAVPILLARARFGKGDLGVNRARIERWLRKLD